MAFAMTNVEGGTGSRLWNLKRAKLGNGLDPSGGLYRVKWVSGTTLTDQNGEIENDDISLEWVTEHGQGWFWIISC